ncbi:hypothetical protein Trydic_g22694 [Trypoxylus dichotomus]
MVEEFTADEPLCKYSKCYDVHNPKDVEKLVNVWKKGLESNLGLVCLTNDEDGKPTIAGMNCTTLCSKFDEKSTVGNYGKVLETLVWVKDQVDPFAKFNITEYLDALGLYVPHAYRGEGLGYELLKAREALCRSCGIKASLTLFTSQISQKLAERAGFKDIYAIDYDELEKKNPKFRYPNIQEHTKSLRFMYILYA